MVVLVLHAPGEPSGRGERDLIAVGVESGDLGAITTTERERLARHREAALSLVVGIGRTLRSLACPDVGVDDDPPCGDPIVVGHLPGEDPAGHTDLRCRQANAVGGVHRLEHVSDELGQLLVPLGHGLGTSVQHGLTGDDNGSDSHRP